MKQFWRLSGFIAVLIAPILLGGHVSAETISVSHEITITATVPSHRDIILDTTGHIVQINSNTKDDVTPDVYRQSARPENSIPLTADLLTAYRQLVPVGTAKYGVLYKQSPLTAVTKPASSLIPAASAISAPKQPVLSRLFRDYASPKQFAFITS